tara:strand:+ start:172 stop:744 length:573 start_codon:yes stop_codon:yes gene_type:complete
MTLDKRKRKKVNGLVQKIASKRRKIRTGRIEGSRDTEYTDCVEITNLINESKETLDITSGFEHRLQTFDTKLIVCHEDAVLKNGKYVHPRNTKKQNKLRMEIEHLRNGNQGTYFNEETGKRIKEEAMLKKDNPKDWKKNSVEQSVKDGKISELLAKEKFATAMELAALNGEFTTEHGENCEYTSNSERAD